MDKGTLKRTFIVILFLLLIITSACSIFFATYYKQMYENECIMGDRLVKTLNLATDEMKRLNGIIKDKNKIIEKLSQHNDEEIEHILDSFKSLYEENPDLINEWLNKSKISQ